MHPKLGALAVLVRETEVLLVQRKKEPDAGLWGFPGGHVEAGETGLEAAIRELHEETTVVARPIRYLTNVDVIQHDKDGALQFHYLLAAVLCDFVSGVPTAGDDASDARWFPVDHVLSGDLATSRNVGTVLRRAITA